MAYCVAGAYTIQNCLAVGTQNLYGDIVLCGTNRSYGEGIVANPSPSGYMALFFRAEAYQGSSYTCTWAFGKNAANTTGGEVLQIVREGLTGGTAYRADALQQWKPNGDSTFGFNVGIGTTTPGAKLDVTGTIRTTPGSAGFCADHTYLGITYRLGTGEVSDNIDFRICGGSAGGFTTGGNFRWHTQVGNTAPTERMRITPSGNVGIGTTSPRYALDVAGGAMSNFYMSCCNATIDGIGPYDYGIIGTGNGAGALLINDIVGARYSVAAGSYNLTFRKSVRNTVGACVYCTVMTFVGTTDTNCVVNVNIANSLGVGLSPSERLAVGGLQGQIQLRVDTSDGSTVNVRPNAGRCGWISYTEDAVADRWGIGIKNGDAKLYFSSGNVASGGGTTRMVIDGSGNVGIGTTSPQSKFHVEGGQIRTHGLASDDITGCSGYYLGNAPNTEAFQWQMSCGFNLSLWTYSGSGGLNWGLRGPVITQTGRVGISTTSPSTPLQIRSGTIDSGGAGLSVFGFDGAVEFTTTRAESPANVAIYLYNRPTSGTNGTGTGISFRASSTNIADRPQGGFYSSWTDSTDATRTAKFVFDLVCGGTYATRMTLLGNGNLGIGTTSPSYKLHVNGTFYAAGSSIKYKEGICQYDTNSCLFMCLKPVTYQYKDEFKHLGKELKSETQIGLIAEDVADVMPELAVLVNEEDKKVVRNVDYEKLSIVLLTELQKLRKEVDELKTIK